MSKASEVPPHLAELTSFLAEFNAESQRGAALLAGSMIDERLLRVLEAFLMEGKPAAALLCGFNAPLGTFAARTAACAAMGLISEREHKEIETIRAVRNEFGHKLGVTFDSQKVAAHCSNLTMSIAGIVPPGKLPEPISARTKFVTASVSVIVALVNRPYYVSPERLRTKDWQF